MKQHLQTRSRTLTPTICHIESNNTDGKLFTYTERMVVTTAAPTVFILIKTDSKKVTLADNKFTANDGELSIYLKEDAVVSAAGTSTSPVCRNRIHGNASTVDLQIDPTLSDEGNIIYETAILDVTTGHARSPGASVCDLNFILDEDSYYVWKLENLGAGDVVVLVELSWIEE